MELLPQYDGYENGVCTCMVIGMTNKEINGLPSDSYFKGPGDNQVCDYYMYCTEAEIDLIQSAGLELTDIVETSRLANVEYLGIMIDWELEND